MSSSIPAAAISQVASELAVRLSGRQWAVRGTASLVLQGLDMGVTDIDILCDESTAEYLIPSIKYSESSQFKSYFGHLTINQIAIEVMGNWQVKNKKGEWSEVFDARPEQITRPALQSLGEVWVTTVDTELKCALLMGRFSEYHKIKRQLSSRLPLLG